MPIDANATIKIKAFVDLTQGTFSKHQAVMLMSTFIPEDTVEGFVQAYEKENSAGFLFMADEQKITGLGWLYNIILKYFNSLDFKNTASHKTYGIKYEKAQCIDLLVWLSQTIQEKNKAYYAS